MKFSISSCRWLLRKSEVVAIQMEALTVTLQLKCRWCVAALWIVGAIGLVPAAVARTQPAQFESDVETATKPWTHLNFYNDPKNFKFAIVSDRAGGVRPGVFEDAAKKLNLIMPEFVMSVGDFIPGNTADRGKLAKEWAEFDAELKPLKVPFFFVPGNHDINNDVMRDVWKERSGVPYYSFVYKNVLFLALDSTGEKGDIIPDAQVALIKKALDKHPDARWTFVFLHHPLWLSRATSGFAKIEKLLEGRRHTVIAGHFHRYLHEWRNNTNYYVLASTGGGSKLRGPKYGEFDHVTLVTVTEEGPVMANLTLDGILTHDVTTRDDYDLTESLAQSSDLPYLVLTDHEDAVSAGTVYLTFWNPAARELQVKANFQHGHEVRMDPSQIEMTILARSEKVVAVNVKSSEASPTKDPALLQLDWIMGFNLAKKEELYMSGRRDIPLRPSRTDLIRTVAPEFVDPLSIVVEDPKPGYTVRYTIDGSTPTNSSMAYERPFAINEATTVQARMFNKEGHGTATSRQTYKHVLAGTGLRYRYYKGNWTRMPDFTKLKPVFEGVATDLNVESRQLAEDHWGMILEGNFDVDAAGQYTFYLKSDDGSKLYVDDQLVIDNDGDHSLLELSGATKLSAGKHKLRIEFFEAGGEAILELELAGPGMERQRFLAEKVSH
jgi:PA14 domain/Chitobiase/beta-hexosaminidase C-terminal domain/Calcineurin-like phosphoesterase